MGHRVDAKMEREEIVLQSDYDADAAEMAADIAAARAYARTPAGRLEQLDRRIDALRAARHDSGTYSNEQIAVVEAERDALRAEIAAAAATAFAAEWTRETTIARRAAWNALVRAGRFGRLGSGRTDWAAVRAQERAQGWTTDDLKRAIKAHGL